ncbi:MAG: protein disulfide oxidoreductase [Gammaproteobacteria bacterium]|nr:protein disulfide oxidoreductase [Gammaproteobacteria bacterium]
MKYDPRPLWRRWLPEVILVIAILFAVNWWNTRNAARGPVPPLQAVTLSGAEFNVEQFRGKPAVIHFWASWCPICRAEQDAIDAVGEDHALITVAMQSGDDLTVQGYLDDNKLKFAVINDRKGELADRFGVTGVPTSFVLDRTGEIRFIERGYTTSWGLRFRLWLAEVTAG